MHMTLYKWTTFMTDVNAEQSHEKDPIINKLIAKEDPIQIFYCGALFFSSIMSPTTLCSHYITFMKL